MRTDIIRIDQTRPLERLDSFLRHCFPAVSRGALQRLIETGHIRVNGRMVKPTHHPHAGEEVAVKWPEPKPARVQPESIPLEVLFEDADLLVVNKPPGLVVHPAAGHGEHTLVNALLHHCQGQLSGIGGVARPGIVHRLDKETSGCLVAAKNDFAHLALAEQFQSREVRKIYQALVCGVIEREGGEIRAAIARHPAHRKRMAVLENGRQAWTSFRVLGRLAGATWVEIHLHTGRTHQIRVHFHHLGFPLVGDGIYGKKAQPRLEQLTGYQAPRQMLHAFRLGFRHPRTEKRLEFEAALPEDFRLALEALRTARKEGIKSQGPRPKSQI